MDFVVVVDLHTPQLESILQAKPVVPFEPKLELTSATVKLLEDWLRSNKAVTSA
jgi:hypothetical protein